MGSGYTTNSPDMTRQTSPLLGPNNPVEHDIAVKTLSDTTPGLEEKAINMGSIEDGVKWLMNNVKDIAPVLLIGMLIFNINRTLVLVTLGGYLLTRKDDQPLVEG